MRLTIVTRIFAPEPSAASQRLESFARASSARGDDVQILTTTPRGGVTLPVSSYRVSRWPVLRDRSGYVRGYLQYLSFDVPVFFRLLFSRRADIVLVEPPPTTGAVVRVACALRRTPYAYYAADVWSLAARSTGAPAAVVAVVRALERFALRGAAVVLAVSDGVAAAVDDLGVDTETVVVGHGVDERVYHPEVDPIGAPDAVYMGSASEWHGASVFIDALQLLAARGIRPTVEFVGQGSEWNALQQAVDDAGLSAAVTFIGSVDTPEAAGRLRGARVALASLRPGIGYDFAVPTKMYAAMAVGTPVLFCGPGPLGPLVERNGLGWSSPYDVSALAYALESATAAPVGESSRRRSAEWAAAHVSATAVSLRVAAALDAALARRARGSR